MKDPSKWMSYLEDDVLVSALTIPGTHDSAAFTLSWPFIQTQKMDILQQLNEGIRYFDFRCGITNDIVEMVHGISRLGLTLEVLLNTMYIWLLAHPSEGLIVQIKQDKKPEKSTVHFSQAICKVLASNSQYWRTSNTTPTLSEVRGKIQLFRRFDGPSLHAYGIDVTRWQDNPSQPFTIYTRDFRITIQDHYRFPDPESLPDLITKKGGNVSELLARASADKGAHHWYINFTSAFEFNLYYQLTPREIAAGAWWGFTWEDGMNARLRAYLRDHKGKKRYGIVVMDFPESGSNELVDALIQSNMESPNQLWNLLSRVVLLLPLLLLLHVVTTGTGQGGLASALMTKMVSGASASSERRCGT